MSKRTKAMIVAASAYYQQRLEDDVVAMYAAELQDIPEQALDEAFQKIRRDPKITRFPLPAQIRQITGVGVEPTVEQEAVEAVNRIIEAMSKFGYTRPKEAREFIGELGWKVVEREGGWNDVCRRTTDSDLGITKAQWRELAKSLRARANAGTLNEPPKLASTPVSLGEITKKLLEGK